YGITYTPYTASGTCKTSSLIHADIAQLKSYGLIRLYGTDCNQTAEVLSALASPRPKNPASTQPETKIIAALPDLKNQQQNLNLIITATTTNPTGWTRIHSIAVGNELLNSAQATAPEIVSAVQTARTTLRAAGYDGPVVAVDTVPSHLQHPEICQVSDYCAVNCHAFFDDKVTPQEAGRYVRTQVDALREVHDAKKVVVTESGWPHAGMGNGVAVPSAENQRVAVRALREEFRFGGEGEEGDVGLVLFSSFDDLWKVDNAYTFGAEKFWGILGH
ncbi:putative cell wall glucanase (Scw4), partial [Aspergillus homomorphus CBS 101889]